MGSIFRSSMKKYTIKPGDSFPAVAKRNNMPVNAVIKANPGIDPQRLMPGQVINVPEEADLLTHISKIKTKAGEIATPDDLLKAIDEAATKAGIRPDIYRAVISIESKGAFDAKNKSGAVGISQITPDKFREYGVTDPLDIKQSLAAGAEVLASAYKEVSTLKNTDAWAGLGFNKTWELALMIYYGGAPNLNKWLALGAPTNLGALTKEQRAKLGGFGKYMLEYPGSVISAIGIKNPFPNFKGN